MDHRYAIVIFTVSLRSYADAVIDPIDVMGVVKKRMYRSSCTAVTSKGNEPARLAKNFTLVRKERNLTKIF